MSDKSGGIYYRKIGRDAWIKSRTPGQHGMWLTQAQYHKAHMIERENARLKARMLRRQVRRKLRSE